MVDKTDEGQEDGLAGGGLDDGGLANTSGIEIDICAFFGSFGGNIQVENFNNVSYKVWKLSGVVLFSIYSLGMQTNSPRTALAGKKKLTYCSRSYLGCP